MCGCERDGERVHVTHIQTNIREKLDPERWIFVSERERYFTTRVIARETYQGTRDISRERECV